MNTLLVIEIAALPLFLFAIIGFFMCAASLARAVAGRRKIPYFSIGMLIIPLLLILISKHIAYKELENSVADSSVTVRVTPQAGVSPKQFVSTVIDNIYSNKGASGSHPTEVLYKVEICVKSSCHMYTVAQDSRDSEMYWVSFKPTTGSDYPLGFTKLKNEKN